MEENNVNTATEGEAKVKKSNKGLVIGIGVALVAVLVVVLVLVFAGKSKTELTGAQVKEKLEKNGWTVQDYSALMSLASTDETEGMKEMLMAQKDDSAAIFVTYEEVGKAEEYYKTTMEQFDDQLGEEAKEAGVKIDKTKGKNFESTYIHGEVDGEEGYVKISRVGKTVLMIETQDKKLYEETDKALGY